MTAGLPFRILGIDHLGLVAKDQSQAKRFFANILQLPFLGQELVVDQQVDTLMFASGPQAEGGRLELLNATSPESPISAFLSKRGGGIHHLALRVDKLQAALTYLEGQGVELIDRSPRAGAHGSRIAFLHPRSTGGMLIELVETKPAAELASGAK